jgi:diguanylate cyclase (GGDEF)-like protein/PAS domain S-box-containing protein
VRRCADEQGVDPFADEQGVDPLTSPWTASSVFARFRRALPTGNTLPDAMWLRRHVWLSRLLWAHVPAVFAFAILQGNSLGHSAVEGSVIGSFAILAWLLPTHRRRLAASVVALGLLSCSAVVTHLSGGYIEAHFHFFVIVTLLVLYEDWLAFLLAIAFVLLHHGLGSALVAEEVFNHPGGREQPWKFAAIHAGFISALSIGSIVSWRLNEDGRDEARQALEVAQASEERFRDAFANAPIGMALVDATQAHGRFIRVNPALCEMTGFTEPELLGKTFADITHPDDLAGTEAVADALVSGNLLLSENEKRYVHADGNAIPILETSSLIRGEDGVPSMFISQIQDVTGRKQFEEQLAHQALHDALTSLPNRVLFRDRLEQALARRERHQSTVSVLFIDLDRFKLVNDTHGHAAGDEVLTVISERIRGALRETDTVARFGGDEFAVLYEDASPGAGDEMAGRIADAIAEPLDVRGRRVVMSGSIGIVVAKGKHDDPDALLRDADAAMYRAKSDGGGRHQLFHDQLRLELLERVETEDALRHAIERDEFVLHYQPIIDVATGAIDTVEALIRWDRPRQGLVFPDQFITVAEETGLIVSIGEWVLREACREACNWQDAGSLGPKVAVNVSPRQLADPDLVLAVTTALEDSGLSPAKLSLELTETAVMENVQDVAQTMTVLGRLGVELALDDFGTGYSSLGQLKHLPSFDVLKIDRSFTADIVTEEHARALITAAVEMSHSLGLRAVAEGVETADQLDFLRTLGCSLAQGYHFSRPVPADALQALVIGGPSESASASSYVM